MSLILLSATLFLVSFSASCFERSKEQPSLFGQAGVGQIILEQEKKHDIQGDLRSKLLQQYQKWHGTRYKLGGTSHKGIDCSALMQHIFSDIAGLRLPRTTGEQIRRGVKVDRHRLREGDLVFFRSGRQGRHVGVYIGDDEFIHASSSEGVTLSTLDNHYWHIRYITARRVTT